MKNFKKHTVFVILFLIILCLCSCNRQPTPSTYIDLGRPTKEYYQENLIARCVWDMVIFDNKLYIGCGDYDKNTGPTPIIYSDIETPGEWKRETFIPDEQIGRFVVIDGKLTIPGFDPTGSPKTGTYYQYENGVWNTIDGLPDGFHNFDLVEYDGKLFAGIGAMQGQTPVVVSENGKDFERVPMYRNGKPISTVGGEYIRTYNLFVLNNNLYATFRYIPTDENRLISEIYRYDNGAFYCETDMIGKLNTSQGCSVIPPEWAKAVIDDTMFLTTGFLYYTNDMKSFTQISLPEYAGTYDLYMHDDTLYILTASQSEDQYRTVIYSTTTADVNDFKIEVIVDYPVHPTAFAVNDEDFFIAYGKWWNTGAKQNGTIVQVHRG